MMITMVMVMILMDMAMTLTGMATQIIMVDLMVPPTDQLTEQNLTMPMAQPTKQNHMFLMAPLTEHPKADLKRLPMQPRVKQLTIPLTETQPIYLRPLLPPLSLITQQLTNINSLITVP